MSWSPEVKFTPLGMYFMATGIVNGVYKASLHNVPDGDVPSAANEISGGGYSQQSISFDTSTINENFGGTVFLRYGCTFEDVPEVVTHVGFLNDSSTTILASGVCDSQVGGNVEILPGGYVFEFGNPTYVDPSTVTVLDFSDDLMAMCLASIPLYPGRIPGNPDETAMYMTLHLGLPDFSSSDATRSNQAKDVGAFPAGEGYVMMTANGLTLSMESSIDPSTHVPRIANYSFALPIPPVRITHYVLWCTSGPAMFGEVFGLDGTTVGVIGPRIIGWDSGHLSYKMDRL